MKDINALVLAELQKYNLTYCYLFRFYDGTEYYRYTDLDVSLYYADDSTSVNKFQARGFQFSRIGYSMTNIVDDADVTIENRDSVMTDIFADSDAFQGEEGKLWVCLIDTDNQVVGTLVLFSGKLDSFVLNEEELSIKIVTLFNEWNRSVKHKQPGRCRWKVFKGSECKYAGTGELCNRIYPTCVSYGNEVNFGGFRWLSDLENQEFKWGPGGNSDVSI